MTEPKNPIEWLHDRIAYCIDIEELRGHALALLLAVNDSDTIQDIYQNEMDADGYFDGYDDGYDDGSDWLDDKEAWDTAVDLHERVIRRRLLPKSHDELES